MLLRESCKTLAMLWCHWCAYKLFLGCCAKGVLRVPAELLHACCADCGMLTFTNDQLREKIKADLGTEVPAGGPPFTCTLMLPSLTASEVAAGLPPFICTLILPSLTASA